MVAIKGMEMPSDCMECMFCNHIKSNDYGLHGNCAILGDGERMNLLLHQKRSDCPLVEIVTCKDCKNECTERNGEKFSETRPDFFCADAEREE